MFKKKMLTVTMAGLLFLTGCGAKGKKIPSQIEPLALEELDEGYYIKKENKFYPVLKQGLVSDQTSKYQWFIEPFDKLIPTLGPNDTFVYYSPTKRPDSYEFARMIDYDYTIGMRFDLGGDSTWSNANPNEKIINFASMSAGNYNDTSPIAKEVSSSVSNIDATKIVEVNSQDIKPTMFTKEGFMLGLTKDALYKFGYYTGTEFYTKNLKADTHLFVQEQDGIFRSTSFIEEKDRYFTVNLPSNMEKGFYVVDSVGMFEYVPDGNAAE